MTVHDWPWPEITTGVVSLFLGGMTFLSSRRATAANAHTAAQRVDAEAYTRAQTIYDHTIDQLRKQNEQLLAQVDRLERQVAKLEQAIRDQGIDTR